MPLREIQHLRLAISGCNYRLPKGLLVNHSGAASPLLLASAIIATVVVLQPYWIYTIHPCVDFKQFSAT